MTSKKRPRLTTKGVVVLGLLGALMFGAQVVMAPLPNIEPVSLLVMVYTVVFGLQALYPIYTFVVLECLIYGINLWTISYLYVWTILAVLAWVLRKMDSSLGWAILSAAFGLAFGALCAIVSLFIGGWQFALTWWIAGIPFDALHCAGNFFIALALFKPCRKVLTMLSQQAGLVKTRPEGTV